LLGRSKELVNGLQFRRELMKTVAMTATWSLVIGLGCALVTLTVAALLGV